MTAANVSVLPLLPAADPGDDLVRVDPGNYQVVYVRHQGLTIFRTPKLRVDFRLLVHPEKIVSRWYRVRDFRGRIRAPRNSHLLRELSAVLDKRLRRDQVPVGSLAGVLVLAEVRDVVVDSLQHPLHQLNQYSVITRLLERVQ